MEIGGEHSVHGAPACTGIVECSYWCYVACERRLAGRGGEAYQTEKAINLVLITVMAFLMNVFLEYLLRLAEPVA